MGKKIIPFSAWPGSWGLKGKTREIAEAEYNLEGYELALKLLEIKADKNDINSIEYRRKVADINLEYNYITKSEHQRLMIELMTDETQQKLATVQLDFFDGKISQIEYEKSVATIKDEPWVTVVGMEFGGAKMLEGSFELDWNDKFVESLKEAGYSGPTSDHIVNQWFMEVSKNVALEEFDGTGNFTADAEANLETMKRWQGPADSSEIKKVYK